MSYVNAQCWLFWNYKQASGVSRKKDATDDNSTALDLICLRCKVVSHREAGASDLKSV